MKKEVFLRIVDLIQEQYNKETAVYDMGLDISEFNTPIQDANSHLIGAIYGKEGLSIFEWWCYEKKWGSRKDITMKDSTGNLLCESVEDLYEYLEENAEPDYEIPQSERVMMDERTASLEKLGANLFK
jgi:hypothetical protein